MSNDVYPSLYQNNQTPVVTAQWLNDVGAAVWGGIGTGRGGTPPTTPTQVLANLGLSGISGTANGNVTIGPPSSGTALTVNGAPGASPLAVNGTSVGSGTSVTFTNTDTTSGANSLVAAMNNDKSVYLQAYGNSDQNAGYVFSSGLAHMRIGTSDAKPLEFFTNFTPWGSLSSNGNWTINVPSSGTALTV